MGLLDGGLAGVFASAFSGVYLDGTLHRRPVLESDDGGTYADIDPENWPDEPVKVQPDRATEAMRRAEGFTDKDIRILVLAHGVAAITTADEITILSGLHAGRYSIASAELDAAASHYELRGQRA